MKKIKELSRRFDEFTSTPGYEIGVLFFWAIAIIWVAFNQMCKC
jgi:hypothetical protein